jgi:predicted nucleotide-binding protein
VNTTRFGNIVNHGDGMVVSQENRGTQTFNSSIDRESGDGQATRAQSRKPPSGDRTRNVFVVHGRDEEMRSAMFGLLSRLDLRPLDWEDLVAATGHTSPFLGDVVGQAPAQAQAALVLLTPDDVAKLHPQLHGRQEPAYETDLTGQPRPNVLIELGMVLMAYPERTLIVEAGTLRPIADLAGRNVIKFDGSPEAVGKIVQRLKLAGCQVNDAGSDWRDLRPFWGLNTYQRTAYSPNVPGPVDATGNPVDSVPGQRI